MSRLVLLLSVFLVLLLVFGLIVTPELNLISVVFEAGFLRLPLPDFCLPAVSSVLLVSLCPQWITPCGFYSLSLSVDCTCCGSWFLFEAQPSLLSARPFVKLISCAAFNL